MTSAESSRAMLIEEPRSGALVVRVPRNSTAAVVVSEENNTDDVTGGAAASNLHR